MGRRNIHRETRADQRKEFKVGFVDYWTRSSVVAVWGKRNEEWMNRTINHKYSWHETEKYASGCSNECVNRVCKDLNHSLQFKCFRTLHYTFCVCFNSRFPLLENNSSSSPPSSSSSEYFSRLLVLAILFCRLDAFPFRFSPNPFSEEDEEEVETLWCCGLPDGLGTGDKARLILPVLVLQRLFYEKQNPNKSNCLFIHTWEGIQFIPKFHRGQTAG